MKHCVRHFAVVLLSLGTSFTIRAQQAPEPQGVTAAWDVRSQMASLATDVKRLEPLLKYANPSEWTAKGAPDAYIKQLQSAQSSIQGLIVATDRLAQQPEKLPLALDAFFQMERMELLTESLGAGIRKYQSSELADQISQLLAANKVHRDRLRENIRDLANMREQEFQIANEEAQRCRATLTRQAPIPERKSGKTRNRQQDRN